MKKLAAVAIALIFMLVCPLAVLAASTSDSDTALGSSAQQSDSDAMLDSISEAVESRTDELMQTLTIMAQGMLGIFIVMLLILLVTVILNKATAPRQPRAKKDK